MIPQYITFSFCFVQFFSLFIPNVKSPIPHFSCLTHTAALSDSCQNRGQTAKTRKVFLLTLPGDWRPHRSDSDPFRKNGLGVPELVESGFSAREERRADVD